MRISAPSAQWPNPDCMPESFQPEDKEVVVRRRHQMLPNNSAANIVVFKSSTEQADLLAVVSSSKRDKKKELETTESSNQYYPVKLNVHRQNIDNLTNAMKEERKRLSFESSAAVRNLIHTFSLNWLVFYFAF